MTRFDRKTIAVIGGALSLGVLAWLVFERGNNQSPSRTSSEGKAQGSVSDRRANSASDRGDREQEVRKAHLSKLKERWTVVGKDLDKNAIPTDEQKALVEESARLLLASQETLDLTDFLAANGMTIAGYLIRDSVGELFASSFSAEARKSLVDLTSHAEPDHTYISGWCFNAGMGAEPGDVASFRNQIHEASYAQEVTFGQNLKLAQAHPKEAIISTLDALKSGQESMHQEEILEQIMKILPQDSDYPAVEALLPQSDSGNSSIAAGRTELFKNWAQKDPAAAANYVMEHPDRLEPQLISAIASVVMTGDRSVGLEWVQTFPEGPYFDQAAAATLPYIYQRWPDQAVQIFELIQDPKLKERFSEYLPKQRKGK